MQRNTLMIGLVAAALIGASGARASIIESYTPPPMPPRVNFEGLPNGTLVSNQYMFINGGFGVTFSQTPSGSPMINTYPWIAGYGAASGVNVLTGSTQGGNSYPTVAGIIATFRVPEKFAEIFLSDTSPLGNYPITIFGKGGSVLASFTVPGSAILPPGYVGGLFPPPGATPLPGIFVGDVAFANDIYAIEVGPSTAFGDSFAVDDLYYGTEVPEPATWALMLTGLGGLGAVLRSRRRPATAGI